MNSLNKLGTILLMSAIFALCLVVLVVEFLYGYLRRRVFLRRCNLSSNGGGMELGSDNDSPSKELLYFFCWKNQTARVEPDTEPTAPPPPPPHVGAGEVDDELAKLQQLGLYGPSRVLYTIKEEEREGMVTETDEYNNSSTEDLAGGSRGKRKTSSGCICLDDLEEATTPFWTPSASPPYQTPSSSPSREGNISSSLDKEVGGDECAKSSVCIETHA